MATKHFVYLYRDRSGRPIYVGYGHSAQRAISHRGASHNKELKGWLAKDDFDLQLAGPYSSEQEAKAVEAALISSMQPRFNRTPGDGPKFAPVGVPPHLWQRPQMKPLTLGQIGKITGGALLVYLSPGERLRDGRQKFNAGFPDDVEQRPLAGQSRTKVRSVPDEAGAHKGERGNLWAPAHLSGRGLSPGQHRAAMARSGTALGLHE
jgi:hypothetical protein